MSDEWCLGDSSDSVFGLISKNNDNSNKKFNTY